MELPLHAMQPHAASATSFIANVQVRVMPRCWYVLLRFFLRVDKVLVKLRETRLFCPFTTDSTVGPVIREIKYSEGTFEELSQAGAPPDGVGKLTICLQGAMSITLQSCHHACNHEFSSPGLSCQSHLPHINAALLRPCLCMVNLQRLIFGIWFHVDLR